MHPFTLNEYTLRLAGNDDLIGIRSLIDSVYREYGDSLNLDDADSDLLDIKENYFKKGAVFVVLVDEAQQVFATHSVFPLQDGAGNFRRLYLLPSLRGSDWGNILMDWAILQAQAMRLTEIDFWSDSRFTRAHRYFERFGFQHDGRVREMSDGNMPYSEKYFRLQLANATLVSTCSAELPLIFLKA